MKKRLLVLFYLSCTLVILLFLTACGAGNIVKSTEDIDASTRIVTTTEIRDEINYSVHELHYIKDGKMYKVWFSQRLRPALDYLRANSKPSEKVMTWWDNGHLVRGYVRRDPIVYTPTHAILDTVAGGKWDEEKLGKFAKKEDITNVAYAMLADSPRIAQGIMKRYKAKWVFVAKIDQKKIAGMVQLLDEQMGNYLDDLGEPKASVMHKLLFRMSDGWPVKGFALRYEDDYAYVYELTG